MSHGLSRWGWGEEDKALRSLSRREELGMQALGFKLYEEPVAPTPSTEVHVPQPRFTLPQEWSMEETSEREERLRHTLGQSFPEVIQAFKGEYKYIPDYVVFPSSEKDIEVIFSFCSSNRIAVLPWGGGSSVVQGVGTHSNLLSRYAGALVVDMGRMNAVENVDEVSLLCTVQAGAAGPEVEAALKPLGLTLRYYPQSFEFATAGGWVATRGGGHFATELTHIDDLVHSLTIVTPRGVIRTIEVPESGAGPSQKRFFLGSEGMFGIITRVVFKIRPRPATKLKRVFEFEKFLQATEAVRKISQLHLNPANLRVLSPREALMNGATSRLRAVAIIGFESPVVRDFAEEFSLCTKVCQENGGVAQVDLLTSPVAVGKQKASDGANNWRNSFIEAPYRRDRYLRRGIWFETFETTTTWKRFPALHEETMARIKSALNRNGVKSIVTCRVTHVYPDGPAPYYTVYGQGAPERMLNEVREVKIAASSAFLEMGGTCTHHHAVGRMHAPYFQKEMGDVFCDTLCELKRFYDPKWILNPGVIIDEPKQAKL